ncbi:protein kinase [Desulfococcaceae bacterium HSG7]|nr:protein kinase [Desulfococcaceae bacterium HSG7]
MNTPLNDTNTQEYDSKRIIISEQKSKLDSDTATAKKFDDEEEFQETVAITREELEQLKPPDEEEFQETVAITREELEQLKPPDEEEFQETVAITREELEQLKPPDEEEFQETVAITCEELEQLKLSDEEEFQETVANSHEELEPMKLPGEEFQETVAISREELEQMKSSDAGEFHETATIPPDESEPCMPMDEEEFQETVAISRKDLELIMIEDGEAFQETLAIPPDELDRMMADEEAMNKNEMQETVAISPHELKNMLTPNEDVRDDAEEVETTVDEAKYEQKNEKASKSFPRQAIHQEVIDRENDDISVITAMRNKLDKLVSEDAKSENKDTVIIPQVKIDQMLESGPEQNIEKAFKISPAMTSFETIRLEKKYFHENVCKGLSGGKYTINKKLFAGGMGAIIEAEDRYLSRISAMKVILPEKKNNASTLQQFIAEAKITSLLEHPNIIPVHELGLMNATGLYFTMKLAEGEALNDILNKLMNNDAEYIETYNTYHLLNIFRKVCDAVSFAHSRHIIHQDIKPHNVMIGKYGEVLLMDWGLAQPLKQYLSEVSPTDQSAHLLNDLVITSNNRITGSPTYMSPEQTYGDPDKMCERSDIFLLGAMLYHIFTMAPPYNGKNMREVILKARAGDFIAPQKRDPQRQIPDEINRIILKAMAFKKEDRYQTVDAMSHDIDDIIAGKWSQQAKKDFQKGEMLMTEGAIGEEAYLILKGSVRVVKERAGKKIVLGLLKAGDIVGEMSLIRKEKRSASVEAVELTQAAVLNREVLSQNLKKLPPYMEKIVSAMNDRLRVANEKIHPHLVRDCTYVILKQLRLLYQYKLKNKSDATAFSEGIETDAIIAEIAEDLGLPYERVNIVVSHAAKIQLIDNTDNIITIPDDEKLFQFCKRAKAGL